MSPMLFRQLFDQDTWTYTYILADAETKDAVLIDPVLEKTERDLNLIKELGLRLKYTIETHTHADHITGATTISAATGAKRVVGRRSGAECAEILIDDGEELAFGRFKIKALSTPGHTDGCTSYYCDGKLFTGDALMIRSAGRTDFQQGSPEKLYDSVHGKLYGYPDETFVYPGHDYRGMTVSTIGEEKELNPRLRQTVTKEQFAQIMNNLNLALPRRIHEAVPANLKCGDITRADPAR